MEELPPPGHWRATAPPAPAATSEASPYILIKQTLPDSHRAGQPLILEVNVTNTGSRVAESVTLNGWWTEGFDLAETSVPIELAEGRRTWMLGTIRGGKSRSLTLKLTPSTTKPPTEFRSSFDASYKTTASDTRAVPLREPEGARTTVDPSFVTQARAQTLGSDNPGALHGVRLVPPVVESSTEEAQPEGPRSTQSNFVTESRSRVRAAEPRGLPVAPLFPQFNARSGGPAPSTTFQPFFPRFHPSPNQCPPAPPLAPNDPNQTPPKLPTEDEIARNAAPQAGPFAVPSEGGGVAARTFNDNFNGDFGGIAVRVRRAIGTTSSTQTLTQNRQQVGPSGPFGPITSQTVISPGVNGSVYQDFFVPGGARYGGILITDNDTPRPTTRVYLGANYYGGINARLNPASGNGGATALAATPLADSTETVGGVDFNLTQRNLTVAATSQQFVPNLANASLVRETVGFEYAFWNDTASFGMRLPFSQNVAPRGFGGNYLGDLSVLLKYAFYDNRRTGDLMSAGLVVSTPIGNDPNIVLADGSQLPVSVLYQPWLGGIWMFQRGYVQGISSLLIPTNRAEPTLVNNSIAASYFLYRNDAARLLKVVAPAVEFHVRTPLNDRDPNGLIFLQDQVNMTSSIHFRSNRITVSPAFSIPLVGPKPWNYEGMLWINMQF